MRQGGLGFARLGGVALKGGMADTRLGAVVRTEANKLLHSSRQG